MKTRTFMLILLAAALPASIAAQTTSHASWRVDEARMRVQAADTFKETAVALHFEADGIEIRSPTIGASA